LGCRSDLTLALKDEDEVFYSFFTNEEHKQAIESLKVDALEAEESMYLEDPPTQFPNYDEELAAKIEGKLYSDLGERGVFTQLPNYQGYHKFNNIVAYMEHVESLYREYHILDRPIINP